LSRQIDRGPILRDAFKWSWSDLKVSPERGGIVIQEISEGSLPGTTYYAMIAAASLIASLGLVANSPAVVIGAMLVSPLMTPIFGMALGIIRGDTHLIGRAIGAEVGGVLLAILCGILFGFIPMIAEVTPEMLVRTKPTLLDLLVAVFAGMAGTLALIDERISPVLPGVAVSTAIVPPLSTCGLCLAMGAVGGASGALLLFLANFLAVLLASSVVFIFCGLGRTARARERRQLFRRLFIAVVSFCLVGAFLTDTLTDLLRNERQERIIKRVFSKTLTKTPNTSLIDVLHKRSDGKVMILANVRTSKVFTPNRVKKLQQEIANELGMPAELVVRNSLSKDVTATGSTSAVTDPNLNGDFISDKMDADMVSLHLADQALWEVFSNMPQVRLLDVDIHHIASDTVILASIQSQRNLVPGEIRQIEKMLRRRLTHPALRLVIRCQVTSDMTSSGRILYGAAHFGKPPEGVDVVKQEMRSILKGLGEFHVTNLDAIWTGTHWSVRAEIYGPRVITPKEVAVAEKQVASRTGKPVKLSALSKAELLVMDNRTLAEEEFTIEELSRKIGPFPVQSKADKGDQR